MAQINQDLTNYDSSFEPLPAGEYVATIEDSEIKESKTGNQYILWTFRVQNRKIWEIMVIGQQIAMERLKNLAISCGHKNPNYIEDTEELHGLQCIVKLKIEKSDEYDDKNKISYFKPLQNEPGTRGSNPAMDAMKEKSSLKPEPEIDHSSNEELMPWEK